MAFSKDQKNQLSLMVDRPEEFLQKCKEGKIYIAGFNGEYFKDGTGILHLLADGVIHKKEKKSYLELFNYLLEQENGLSLFAYTGRKESAFGLLKNAAKDNSEICPIITNLLLKQKSIKNDDSYMLSSFVTLLAEKGFVKEINDVLEKFPQIAKDKSLHQSLLKSAIEFNKLNVLDYVLSNQSMSKIMNDEIGTYKFSTSKPYNNPKYGNIYTYCLSCENEDALFKIIDKLGDKVNFDGTFKEIKEQYYNYSNLVKDTHPLEIILRDGSKESFEKYYTSMDIGSRTAWLCTDHNRRINSLYRKSYHNVVLNDLENIFTSEKVKDTDKLSVYNQLLYFSKDTIDIEKYQNIEKIIEPLWDKIISVNKATSFNGNKSLFDSFYSKGDMSEGEINSFINIFKKIKDRGELLYSNRLYSSSFFNEPKLVKGLLNAGLGIDIIPTDIYIGEGIKDMSVNVYDHFLHAYEYQNKNSNMKKIDDFNFDRVKETLEIIYNHNPELVFKKTKKDKTVLQLAIEQNCREIFELFTLEDFKKFKEIDGQSILEAIKPAYSPSKEHKENFDVCLNKLLLAGFFDRKENSEIPKMFYYFLDKSNNFDLLDKVFENAKIDLNEEIQKDSFWTCLNTESPALYLKSRITQDIKKENAAKILRTLTFANHQQAHLENLLDVFPDIHKVKLTDGENILHSAIKNDAYDSAKMIVNKFPELAIDANKQNKMPISYMIASFAKNIEKNKDRFSYTEKKHEELFDKLINCGLESPNKKANKILEEQLEKYSVIEKTFPDAITTYKYQKLNRALHKNNAPSTKKMKI